MTADLSNFRVAYIVKMFPRLSETFILNEMLELERRGLNISIFSLKKPDEGIFHPQAAELKARAYYLEGFDVRKWGTWLGEYWEYLRPFAPRLWPLIEDGLSERDNYKLEMLMQAAWIAARSAELGITHYHAHFASLPSSMAYYAHQITGIPFSFTAHAKDIFVYDMNEHLLEKKLSAARAVVTVTEYNRRYLMENAPGIDHSVINVIHNGLDLERFTPVKIEDRQEGLILGVGRLVPKKGFSTLLDACALLKERGTQFKCLIVGDGPDGEMLREKKAMLGLDDNQVEFTGPRTLDEVVELMKESTIFCLPCTTDIDGNRDALPTVIIEALALGLPVISTTISGVPEMIDHEKSGLLVEPDDPKSLADEMERLLGSRTLRTKLAAAGQKRAEEKFDLRKNAQSLLNLFLGDRRPHSVGSSIKATEP